MILCFSGGYTSWHTMRAACTFQIMDNYRISPEVGTLMSACEELFSRIIINRKLTTLDREILQYYADELQEHLLGSGGKRILASVPQNPTLEADALEVPAFPLRLSYMHNFESM